MKRDDAAYLRHILDAIAKVESYLDGVEHRTFDATTLIHQYFGVDIDRVWMTAKDDLPSLKTEVAAILDSLEG